MSGTPLVVALVEWTRRGLSDIDVLKTSEDTQPCGAVVVGKHRPQTMPAITFLELEHNAKVRLIPGRLLGTSGIKGLVTHPNRSASVDGQANVHLTAALRENPVGLGVHFENLVKTGELRVVPVNSDLV